MGLTETRRRGNSEGEGGRLLNMGREAIRRNKRKYIRQKKRGRKKKEGEAVQSTGRGGRWEEWGQPKVNLIQHGILSSCCRWELGSF